VCAVLCLVLPGIGVGLWARQAAAKVVGDLGDVTEYGAGNPSPARSYDDHVELLIALTAAGLLFALAAVIGFFTLAVKRRRARNRA